MHHMNHDSYDNSYISGILNSVKTIAMVGASANDVRPSYFVMKYLIGKGFAVFPVNPGHAGKEPAGRRLLCYCFGETEQTIATEIAAIGTSNA